MNPINQKNGHTEASIQNVIWGFCNLKNHELIVPNSCLFAWEADVLTVTRAGLVHEFEIKISVADFRRDSKKLRARVLVDPIREGRFETTELCRPNYFWYAVPAGLIDVSHIPPYAGLLYVPRVGDPSLPGWARVLREPQRLHSKTLSDNQARQLSRALTQRYWAQRTRDPDTFYAEDIDGVLSLVG